MKRTQQHKLMQMFNFTIKSKGFFGELTMSYNIQVVPKQAHWWPLNLINNFKMAAKHHRDNDNLITEPKSRLKLSIFFSQFLINPAPSAIWRFLCTKLIVTEFLMGMTKKSSVFFSKSWRVLIYHASWPGRHSENWGHITGKNNSCNTPFNSVAIHVLDTKTQGNTFLAQSGLN